MDRHRKFSLTVFILFLVTQFTFLGLLSQTSLSGDFGFVPLIVAGFGLLLTDFVGLHFIIFSEDGGDGKYE